MMEQQQQQQPTAAPGPLKVWMDLCTAATGFISLPLTVFSRRRLGFRRVKPTTLTVVCGLLAAYGLLAGRVQGSPWPTVLFAAAAFGMGLWHRRREWNLYAGGAVWHPDSLGISLFDAPWLPAFFALYRRAYRWLEPAAWGLLGLLAYLLSPVLSFALLVMTGCLRFFEDAYYEAKVDEVMNMIAGLANSGVQSQAMAFFQSPAPPPLAQTAGVAVLAAPDLQRGIARMQQQRAATGGVRAGAGGTVFYTDQHADPAGENDDRDGGAPVPA